MTIKTIELESTFTPYTIDTYATFTMEDDTDYLLEDINNIDQETGLERDEPLDLTYSDIDWQYDTAGYLKCLAENWLNLLNKNILDDVILEITSDLKVQSPKEYNFTTDTVFAEWKVNIDKLKEFCQKNPNHYKENKLQNRSGFLWMGNEEETMLAYYLEYKSEKEYTENDYYNDQRDNSGYGEFITAKIIK